MNPPSDDLIVHWSPAPRQPQLFALHQDPLGRQLWRVETDGIGGPVNLSSFRLQRKMSTLKDDTPIYGRIYIEPKCHLFYFYLGTISVVLATRWDRPSPCWKQLATTAGTVSKCKFCPLSFFSCVRSSCLLPVASRGSQAMDHEILIWLHFNVPNCEMLFFTRWWLCPPHNWHRHDYVRDHPCHVVFVPPVPVNGELFLWMPLERAHHRLMLGGLPTWEYHNHEDDYYSGGRSEDIWNIQK